MSTSSHVANELVDSADKSAQSNGSAGNQSTESINLETNNFSPQVHEVILASISHTLQFYPAELKGMPRTSFIMDEGNRISAQIRAIQKSPLESLTHNMQNVVWGLSRLFYSHALPNALDTLYEAVDKGKLSPDETKVTLNIKLIVGEKRPEMRVEIEDNGLGVEPGVLEAWRGRICTSTRNEYGKFMGGRGMGMFSLIAGATAGSTITVDTRHEKGAQLFRIFEGPDGTACRELPPSARDRAGTLVTLSFFFSEEWKSQIIYPD